MRPLNRILLPTLISIAGFTTASLAQFAEDALRFSQYNGAVGPRAMALGGTAVGRAEDYTALFANPAGLANIRDYELSIGFARNGVRNDAIYMGSTTRANNNSTVLDNAGLVYPIPTTRGSLTFAMGFGRMANYTSTAAFAGFNPASSIVRSLAPVTDLYSMSVEEERDLLRSSIPYQIWLADTLNGYLFPVVRDSVRQEGSVYEGGGVNHWSFGGAIEVAKNLSLGFSLNFVSGTYSYDREFVETDAANVYASTYAFPYNFDRLTYVSTIESELSGFNMLVGVMMRQPGRYRAGVSVRTPTTMEINESFTDEGSSRFDDGSVYDRSFTDRTTYKVVTPFVVSGGLMLQVTEWLSLSGDAEYADWSQVKFETDNPDLLSENRYIKKTFRETVNLRGGIECTLWDLGVVLRGGYSVIPSPYQNDPSSFDQRAITGGLGIRLDSNAMLNVAGSLGTWKSFRDNYYYHDDNGVRQRSSTSESLQALRVSVGITYRF